MSDRSARMGSERPEQDTRVIGAVEGTERDGRSRWAAGRGSIIAGGLMRRHNCTIIDDRFIRRLGPLTGTPGAWSKTGRTEDTGTAARGRILL